jgi:hypothetical protein
VRGPWRHDTAQRVGGVGGQVIDEIVREQVPEVWLNHGSDSDALLARARPLSITPIVARSVVAIGGNSYSF